LLELPGPLHSPQSDSGRDRQRCGVHAQFLTGGWDSRLTNGWLKAIDCGGLGPFVVKSLRSVWHVTPREKWTGQKQRMHPSYFDSIPHDLLMVQVSKHTADGRLLTLIDAFVKQEVVEDLASWKPEEGTLQGAVISPLLANLYLDEVDKAMEAAGYMMIRYADDFVVLCRSQEEAEAALLQVRKLAEERGLTLHPEKTRLVDATIAGQGFDFLGYHFEQGQRWPRKKSLKKVKDAIRAKTKRCNGHSMATIIGDVNAILRGWFEYYKHSKKWIFLRLDGWIRRRLRSVLRKCKGLRGISRGRDHQRWPNRYFQDRGFYSLEEAHRISLQSSRG